MRKSDVPKSAFRATGLASFTLIELLVVMAIIAILAALILNAGFGVMAKAQRSRASSELQAMATALESYKTDNGIYPPSIYPTTATINLLTNAYAGNDGSQSGGYYQASSQALYMALSGQTNFLDTPVSGNKSYFSFKATMLGNATASANTSPGTTSTFIRDPYKFAYGYNTGTSVSYPYNGNGFFDLWSNGDINQTKESANNSLTNAWISNWTQ